MNFNYFTFRFLFCQLFLLPTPANVCNLCKCSTWNFLSFSSLFAVCSLVLIFSYTTLKYITSFLLSSIFWFSFFAFFSVVFIYYAYSSHLIMHTQGERVKETLTHTLPKYIYVRCSPCIELNVYMRRISATHKNQPCAE